MIVLQTSLVPVLHLIFEFTLSERDPVCAENTVLAQSPHTFSPLK